MIKTKAQSYDFRGQCAASDTMAAEVLIGRDAADKASH